MYKIKKDSHGIGVVFQFKNQSNAWEVQDLCLSLNESESTSDI